MNEKSFRKWKSSLTERNAMSERAGSADCSRPLKILCPEARTTEMFLHSGRSQSKVKQVGLKQHFRNKSPPCSRKISWVRERDRQTNTGSSKYSLWRVEQRQVNQQWLLNRRPLSFPLQTNYRLGGWYACSAREIGEEFFQDYRNTEGQYIHGFVAK